MKAKAAFYDVDGTLVKTNTVHTYAYYAMNRGSILGIASRTLGTLAGGLLGLTTVLLGREMMQASDQAFTGQPPPSPCARARVGLPASGCRCCCVRCSTRPIPIAPATARTPPTCR